MTDSFSKQIEAIVNKNIKVLEAVAKQSIQDVVNRSQLQGPSVANPSGGKGGDMPVDTGFLRASGAGSLEGMPSGPSSNPQKLPHKYSDNSVVSALANLKLGDTFYFGWTADYALKTNVRYGFMDKAIQNWQGYVTKNAEDAAKRMK